MSDEVATRIVVFAFVAILALTLFTWFSVSHWISARTAERKDRERNALLRHLATQPAENVRLVLDKMREDEEQARKDAAAHFAIWTAAHERGMRQATPGPRGGLLIVAVGAGLSIFLYSAEPESGVWTLGLIPVLVGGVVTAFALFARPDTRARGD
jgi:hypothetical protein